MIIVVLFGFPVLLITLGWMIHENLVGIDEEDVLQVPVLGWLYAKVFNPFTYYNLDTAIMFQESVGRAVHEVIDELLTDQGLQGLSTKAKRPTMRDLTR